MLTATLPAGRAGNLAPHPLGGPEVRSLRDQDLQRANGFGRLVLGGSEKATRIVDVSQRSPIRIIFPRTVTGPTETVLLNTAGGLAGGDRLRYGITALAGASIAVTSQAAEKVYRALNEPAHITTTLRVCSMASLAWLPQETIVFNGGGVIRRTEVEISSGAELLAVEWLVLGRAARGEQMTNGHVTDSWRVRKDGSLIWADSFRATEETFPHLGRKALLSDSKAIGTLIYFGQDFATRLESLRRIAASLECHCAVTTIEGLIIVRFAASVGFHLRVALRSFLEQAGRTFRASVFRVPKMWLC